MIDVDRRAELVARGASEWRDPRSPVRAEARDALRGGAWSPPVVEAALDNVLWNLDGESAKHVARDCEPADPRPVLVVLPGNIIGPAVACAYCAAAAGASVIMKSPGAEQALAKVVARQFDRLGPPLAGTVDARYWKGGDTAVEAPLLASVRHGIVFGSDETVAELRRSPGTRIIAYGDSYSIGLVLADADLKDAAANAARDVCIFDQRGCMSPQTIYVEGDDGRALRFAHALAAALRAANEILPRGPVGRDEAEAIAMAIRRLAVSTVAPRTHGLDALIVGKDRSGAPEFVVAVEPPGPPTRHGYGRIVAVKACTDVRAFADAIASDAAGAQKETVGYAGTLDQDVREELQRRFFLRICALGEMQRPPFGYRPRVEDFA